MFALKAVEISLTKPSILYFAAEYPIKRSLVALTGFKKYFPIILPDAVLNAFLFF